jgi:hypothetical protein
MKMNYAPLARIALRYGVGASFIGSAEIGERLAACQRRMS